MDRRQFGLGLLGFGVAAGCARAQVPAPAVHGLVGEILRETGAPALGGVVVTPEGTPWLEAGGLRRADQAVQVTPQDPWHLGSNTKAMTAAVYGRLVEQGRARWGATVAELFPGLTADPAWRQATIEALLAHRAGVSDRDALGGTWLMAAHADKRPLQAQRRALAEKVLAAPPTGKPGAFEYSNANYILAGAAIEAITGEAWETVIQRELFEPLAMKSAGFGAPAGEAPWGHTPPPFGVESMGGRPVDPKGIADNPAALGPAGTAHASLGDYASFLRLFITEGAGLLQPATIARLTAPWGEGEPAYALGWGVVDNAPWSKTRALLHNGSNTMWFATAIVIPERRIAVAAVSNDAGKTRGEKACRTLASRLLQEHAADWARGPA